MSILGLFLFNPGAYPWRRHTVYFTQEQLPAAVYKQQKRGQAKGQGQQLKRLVPDRQVKTSLLKKRSFFPWVSTEDLAQSSQYKKTRTGQENLFKRANQLLYNVEAENPGRKMSAQAYFSNSRASKPVWLGKNVRAIYLHPRVGRTDFSQIKFNSKSAGHKFVKGYLNLNKARHSIFPLNYALAEEKPERTQRLKTEGLSNTIKNYEEATSQYYSLSERQPASLRYVPHPYYPHR